jgi:hypothetical protein
LANLYFNNLILHGVINCLGFTHSFTGVTFDTDSAVEASLGFFNGFFFGETKFNLMKIGPSFLRVQFPHSDALSSGSVLKSGGKSVRTSIDVARSQFFWTMSFKVL